MRYDFQVNLDANNYFLIEVDGQAHRKPVRYGNMSHDQAKKAFKLQQLHDSMKTNFAEWMGVNLLRLPTYNYKLFEVMIVEYIRICKRELFEDWYADERDKIDLDVQHLIDDLTTVANICRLLGV